MKVIPFIVIAAGIQAIAVPRILLKRAETAGNGLGITVNGDGSSNLGGELGITTNADGSQSVGGASGINVAAPKKNGTTGATGVKGSGTGITVAGSEINKGNQTGIAGTATNSANKPQGTGNADGLTALLGALNGAGASKNGTATAASATPKTSATSGGGADGLAALIGALNGASGGSGAAAKSNGTAAVAPAAAAPAGAAPAKAERRWGVRQ